MKSIEEIQAEWKEALKEHQAAIVQYEPFLATGTLTPGVNPIPIPFEDLKAAHNRLKASREWIDRIQVEYIEAVRHQKDLK